MKLTPKSNECFEYIKENGKVAVSELCEALNRTARSVNANITDLQKKGLVVREKVAADGEDEKEITYVSLTEAGQTFVPSDDEE